MLRNWYACRNHCDLSSSFSSAARNCQWVIDGMCAVEVKRHKPYSEPGCAALPAGMQSSQGQVFLEAHAGSMRAGTVHAAVPVQSCLHRLAHAHQERDPARRILRRRRTCSHDGVVSDEGADAIIG